ncbi:MAG: CheR family methyltransferase [Nitrospira sp.]|nr:CheR family methyltransferase [Nitrospira sp.]
MAPRRTTTAARATQRRQSAAVRSSSPAVERGKEDGTDNGRRMLIVGIGASAGGLEAFTQLLTHLPLDTGMAFVLVQHLDPDHESALTQLLSRATRMPVSEITHNQALQANQVYIIPRDTHLRIVDGLLKLGPRARTRTPHRPIDAFFESLAQDQRDRAVGVVLSGTASDGTLGLEAIKAEGGITFAQDDSAKYDSMPRSAVAAGCVDLVLSPSGIAEELARIARHPSVAADLRDLPTRAEQDREEAIAHQDDDQPLPSGGRATAPTGGRQARGEAEQEEKPPGKGAGDGYHTILLLLRNHCGVDFSLYKSNTIQRRIARRIVLTRQQGLEGYSAFLRGNAEELDALFSDVLISVTSFFRNPEAFEALQRDILPQLMAAQRGDEPVRFWVLGCSTGQEAYSLAMAFVEVARKATRAHPLQIFATDLNEKLLEKARQGLYAKTLAQDISPERLREFFREEDGGYRINKALREMVVFARQNLIADPPFSRMDLISCRNLLIYLEPSLQQKALPTFHYALKPHGYLLLGASESVGEFTDLFEPVDRKHKIFSKKAAPTRGFPLLAGKKQAELDARGPRPRPIQKRGLPVGVDPPEDFRGELNAQREADRIAVVQFAPPGVLINDDLQVLQFRGPTGAYLEPPAGKASFDVLKMAREGLMLPLRAAINQAKQGNKTVRTERVRVKRDGVTRTIGVAVIPLKNLRERCFLVVFEEAGKASLAPPPPTPPARPLTARQESHRVAELEADLSETREYLQSVQEQQEAAHEELQASNEEVQSANEELQSINEELETSKEELESANEELTTVNEEMTNRNVELSRLNNDLVNLQTSAKLAIVLLGRDLTIRRFSAQAEKQFDLLAADIGRPINHIRHNLVATGSGESPLDLEVLAGGVIADLREQECEVRDKSGHWHALRVRPYLTLDGKVDGAVLVLVDIDAAKRNEQNVAAALKLAGDTLETVREPLLVLDEQLRVERASRAFYRIFQVAPAETIGRRIYDLGNGQWDIPRLHELLEQIQPSHGSIEEFRVDHVFKHLGRRIMLLYARRIEHSQNGMNRILLVIEDITERTQAEASRARLAAIVESSDDAILSKDLHGIITSWNQGARRLFDYTAEEAVGGPSARLLPPDRKDEEKRNLERVTRGQSTEHYDTVRRRKDGSLVGVSLTVSPIKGAEGRVIGAAEIARDITERERVEAALRQNETLFSTLIEQAPVGMYVVDGQFRVQQINSRALPAFASVQPLIGRDFSDVVRILWGSEVGGQVADIFRHTLETGERYISPEFSRRRYDLGVEQSYDWETQRVTLPDGQVGVVCYFTDTTERRQAAAELEQRVADRTQELTQLHEQLRALTTELTLTEQRERRRLATELHDHLAQLLVLGKMKLGQSKRVTQPRERRDELVEETDEVLSEALAYTRTLVIDLSPPILHEFGLPAALRWLGERMQRHGLAVTVRIETEDLSLPEDRAVLLFQSARELLINTAKHAGVGVAWVSLEYRQETLQIEVRDEGVGFDLAAAAAGSSTMAMSSKFGLFSIRERMQALGGSFEVQSAPGAGTTATLRLPLAGSQARISRRAALGAVQEASEVTNVASVSPASSPSLRAAASIRVLLVDDHAMVRQGLRTLLDSYPDVEVVGEACNGEEAVAFVERVQPSIVVMDINMPKMNGIDATAAIVSRYPGTVVIGLSVQAGGENEESMRKAGAAMLLTKEAAVDDLYKAIRESLDVRLKENVPEQGIEPAPPNS